MKMSRSRSSSTGPVGSRGESQADGGAIMAACSCLASRCDSRRILSMALRVAVVVSQPPGLGGTPSPGHRSTAASRASAAASSATSMLPKRRISEATTRPYSSRKIRSTSASDSGVVTRPRAAARAANGRTSTFPSQAAEPSAASLRAASRSGASMIQNPPIHSLDSANGPSVMIVSAPVASTVVAVSIGSRPPPNTQMPASISFWLNAPTCGVHPLQVVALGHRFALGGGARTACTASRSVSLVALGGVGRATRSSSPRMVVAASDTS